MKNTLILSLSVILSTMSLFGQKNSPGTIRVSGSPLDRDGVVKWLNDANNPQALKSNQNLDLSNIEPFVRATVCMSLIMTFTCSTLV